MSSIANCNRPHRGALALLAAIVSLVVTSSVVRAADVPGSLPGVRKRGEPLERVDEMLRWIEAQRMPDGGWHSKNRFGLDGGLRLDWHLAGIPDGDVASTALVGVTLLRTRDAKGRTPYHKTLVQAIDYVKAAVAASPSNTADLTGKVTPISARVGTYIDTALALLLLAEAAPARTPTDGGPVGAQIEKLIRKLESSQKIHGNWGEGAHNAPLLGHALAVWGLEAASRKGHKIDPGVLALAGKWALGKDADRVEAAAAGKWQTKERGLVPRWLERTGTEDDEPINYELYAAAARLSVLAQADRSNRALETQLLLAARSRGGDPARRAEAARSLEAVKTTRTSLQQAQQAVEATLTKERGAAPFLFAAEDFIACLLIADSLPGATAEEWFPPTVRTLMAWQDFDGGLKTDNHASCKMPGKVGDRLEGCTCERFGPGGPPGPSVERPFCPDNKSFCSQDRVFCTALAVATLLADTPYKAGMFKQGDTPRN